MNLQGMVPTWCLRLLTLFGISLGMTLSVNAEDKKVAEGKPAPNIDLPATQIAAVLPGEKEKKTLSLQDLKGKKNVVLVFFPKAMTGG